MHIKIIINLKEKLKKKYFFILCFTKQSVQTSYSQLLKIDLNILNYLFNNLLNNRLRIDTLYFKNKIKFTRGCIRTIKEIEKNEGIN